MVNRLLRYDYIATLTIVYARISVSQSGTILNLALSSIWLYEEAEIQRKNELTRLVGEMPRLYQIKVQEKIREENKRRGERERGKLMLSGRGPQSEKRSENSNDD